METTSAYPVIVLVSSTLLVLLLVFWYGTRGHAILERLNLPGPKPLPCIGNLLEVKTLGGLHSLQLEYMRRYGKIFTWSLGREPAIVVADPEMLRQILQVHFVNFRNRTKETVRKVQPSLGEMLYEATDEKWSRIRSKMVSVFCEDNIYKVVPLIDEALETFREKLAGVASTGLNVDIVQWFEQLTADTLFLTSFGLHSDVQTNPNSDGFLKFRQFQREQASSSLLDFLPFGTYIKHSVGDKAALFTDLLSRVIHYRREQNAQGLNGTIDFLDLMLSTHGGLGLSDSQIMAQSLSLLLHGYQTSSNTLAFTVYHLATNPQIQEHLRWEIENTMQDNCEIPLATLVDTNMEYLDCVVSESQRLHPACCVFTRSCVNSCIINSVHFPAGIQVAVPIHALHRDPDAWHHVNKFDPDRFRGPAKDSRHPYQYLPFGAGPRNCIGSRLALLEIKLILVKILRKFRFVRSPETQVPLPLETVSNRLAAKYGIFLRVELIT